MTALQVVNHLGEEYDDAAASYAFVLRAYDEMVSRDHGLERWEIVFLRGAKGPADDAMELGLFEHPDVSGALGYHDVDPRGKPYGKAFLGVVPGRVLLHDQKGKGASLAGVVTHEYAEQKADRYANLWAFGSIKDPRGKRRFGAMAYELCDPVQDACFQLPDQHGQAVDCSDYVLPAYFSMETPAAQLTSHCGAAVGPFSVAPGGYAIVARERGETQIFGRKIGAQHDRVLHYEKDPPAWREAMRAFPHSRGSRREMTRAA